MDPSYYQLQELNDDLPSEGEETGMMIREDTPVTSLQSKRSRLDTLDSTLFLFLKCMSQELCELSKSHATEQAQPQEATLLEEDEYDDCIYEKIAEWTQRGSSDAFYDEPALKLNEKMWGIMEAPTTFPPWCRLVANHAPKRRPQHFGTAAEHADCTTEENTKCYRSLAVEMLEEHTTPEQRRQSKYKIKYDQETGEVKITNAQRSWINAMLFKYLGDSKVAYFIFNQGVPAIMDLPLRAKAPTKAMFQNMLEDLMTWHASLLQSLLDREKHPDINHVRRQSALNEQTWNMQRREDKRTAKERMNEGARLIEERDSRKRKFQHLSATEQQILEEYDTGKTHKEHEKASGKRLPQFRGKMLLKK